MCTAITLQSLQKENFFGRTMDFSYPIDPGLFIIPRNHQWYCQLTEKKYTDRYRFICIGQETNGMFGCFDGVNERGFAAAALYFEGYADYDLPINNKEAIASLDFLHYILGRCASLADVGVLLEHIQIVGLPDPVTKKAAPLHWIVTDRSGTCAVIEQTKTGLALIQNPVGVLTNSPDFQWHLTNLRNYINLSVTQQQKADWGGLPLTPFGQGAGTTSLPGGFTSPERFVRTAFLKTHTTVPEDQPKAIMSCFHIMNSVSIPKGIVVTERGDDYTKYIAFMNTVTCEYYIKTYENSQIIKASLRDYSAHGQKMIFLGSIVHPFSA